MKQVHPEAKRLNDAAKAESIERQRRTKVADSKEPADWQSENQPGAFKRVETIVDGTRVSARKRKYSTVLDKYLAWWLADKEKGVGLEKRRGISPDQHETGEDFTEDYMVAVSSLGAKGIDLASAGGGGGGFHESLAAAHEGVTKAFRMMARGNAGKNGSVVVQRVCGHNESLAAVDASMGWKEGHAIIRLREGLDDMMPHYAKLRDRRRKRR